MMVTDFHPSENITRDIMLLLSHSCCTAINSRCEYSFEDSVFIAHCDSTGILEREEVVESDHAAIGVDVEWKVKRRRKMRT